MCDVAACKGILTIIDQNPPYPDQTNLVRAEARKRGGEDDCHWRTPRPRGLGPFPQERPETLEIDAPKRSIGDFGHETQKQTQSFEPQPTVVAKLRPPMALSIIANGAVDNDAA